MRTPISYYGGKQHMLSRIMPMIPPHTQYVEPFFGGGAVFWAKADSPIEVVNDVNQSCITFWRILKSRYGKLKHKLDCTLHSEAQHRRAGEILKNPDAHNQIDIAWAFWVQTNMSFSNQIHGGFAFSNSDREPKLTANKIDQFLPVLSARLKRTQIFCRDAVDLIRLKDRKDCFFYLDPPYAESACGHYEKLKEVYFRLLEILPSIQGMFLLSSYPSGELQEIRDDNGFRSRDFTMPLAVTGKRKTSKTKVECLTWNYPLEETMPLFASAKEVAA